jgi:hypothetical protein
MTDHTHPARSDQPGKHRQRSSSVLSRTVSAVLFAGGLAVCGGALYQPPEHAPTVQLTAGTSGSSSGASGSSSGASGSSSGASSGTNGQTSSSSGASGNTSSSTGASGNSSGASSGTSGASGSSSGASGSGTSGGIGSFLRSLWSRTVAFIGGLISTFLGLLGLGSKGRGGWWFL